MSFAIIRIQKMTIGTVKGIQIHDQREKESEKISRRNKREYLER
jgi:tmRNA-binding protein